MHLQWFDEPPKAQALARSNWYYLYLSACVPDLVPFVISHLFD